MGIVVVKSKLRKSDLVKAREEYKSYIKVTIDLDQEIVVIGGEYHVDAEQLLIRDFGSKQSNIWGGGYNIKTREFKTKALINMRPFDENSSDDILDPEIRKKFLKIAKTKLKEIELLK